MSRCAAMVFCLALPAAASAADPIAIDCPSASEAGQRLRQESKYRAALERFHACTDSSCPAVVRRDCAKWTTEVQESMPSIVIAGVDENEHDLTDAEVSVDGEILTAHLDGKPIPIDPGPHQLQLTASQRVPVSQSVVVRAGEKNRVVRLKFAPKTIAARDVAAAAAAAEPARPPVQKYRYSSVPPVGAAVLTGLGVTAMLGSVPLFATAGNQSANGPLGVGLLFLLGVPLTTVGAIWWGSSARKPIPVQVSASPLGGGGALSVSGRF